MSLIKIRQIDDYLRIFDFCLDNEVHPSSLNINDILALYVLKNSGTLEQAKKILAVYSQRQCSSFSDIALHILYDSKNNTKTKAILMQYYEFLQVSLDSPVIARLKDQRDENKLNLYIAML